MRGVGETWCTTSEKLTKNVGSFDTVVLFGNNFGIFGTPQRLRHVLTQWSMRMAPGARILAESTNPYSGGAPALDRSQYLRNKEQGLMPGQCRLRVGIAVWPRLGSTGCSYRGRDAASATRDWVAPGRTLGTAPRESFVGILEKD